MKKYKTSWDLKLLYKSPKDPQIEKDMVLIEKACADFEKKYRNTDFISTPAKLLKALNDSESLDKKMLGAKPWWYFALSAHTNSEDSYARAMSSKFEQRLSLATNKTTFFALKIAQIPKSKQKDFLNYKDLKPFKYLLEKVFENAKYNLSEKEENLINLFSQTSHSMWVSGQEKVLFAQSVLHKGKNIPVSEVREIYSDLPKKERRDLYKKLYEVYKEVSSFAEAELNAIVSYKKVLDEQKGFNKPYSSTLIANENDERSIEVLAETVTKNFSISHKFFKLYAKLLKEDKLASADIKSKIGTIKQRFSFDKSLEIIRESFSRFGDGYVKILDSFLENGQIDIYPRKGKYSGGYCWKIGNNPTFILLNHVDSIRSVETLAHEIGHAFHNEFSQNQPSRYQDHPASTAEVASTFFEQIINEELESNLSEKEKIILLHNNINRDIQTIFTQIACFNFETELHEMIRAQGQLSKEEMAKLLVKHLRSYRGPAVDTQDLDGYLFVAWSHLRMYFYTYTYTFGHLISKAMYQRWKKDPSFEIKVREFLSAGSSMSPKDLFKKMDIDITDPKFFEDGLKAISEDIKRLEKLAKKEGLI